MSQTMTVSIDGVSVELPVLPGRRVAAALKACEGLSTETLEASTGFGGAIWCQLGLRKELLTALTSLVLFTKPKPFNSVALNRAQQVIAKATGGAQ